MKVIVIFVGKTDFNYLDEGISLYAGRIKHYMPFEVIIIKDSKKSQSLSKDLIKENEAKEILNKVEPTDFIVLLDEKGKEFTSINFAKFIENKTVMGMRRIVFIVGGAYGLSDNIYKRANDILSLSKMTF